MSKASYRLPYHQIFLDTHPELGLDEIPTGWVIHHKNLNHKDNDPDNLQLMTHNDHNRLHMTGNQYWKGKHHSEESKAKISSSNLGNKNGMYGHKEDRQHAIERGKAITEAKLRLITQEMINDQINGMTRKEWMAKYKCSQCIWDRVRKQL